MGIGGKIDLYLTTPRLEKLHAAPLSPTEATGILAAHEAYDLAEPPADYDNVLNQLALQQKYERIYLLTDHPAHGQSALRK